MHYISNNIYSCLYGGPGMLVVKRMHEVPLEEAVSVLHQNDHDIFYDKERNIRHFAARFGREGLSPVLSVVTYDQKQPVGFVLSGVREMGGEKVAWICENVVLPEYRDHHVREVMLDTVMAAFEEEGVTLATLEVNAENEEMVDLYSHLDFEIVDRLLLLKGELYADDAEDWPPSELTSFQVEKSVAQEARFFHDIRIVPWRNQWQSLRSDGELLTILDGNAQRVGHLIFKRRYDQSHNLSTVTIHQWRIEEDHPDAERIFSLGFRHLQSIIGKNVPVITSILASDWQMVERLESIGFLKMTEHVFMIKRF